MDQKWKGKKKEEKKTDDSLSQQIVCAFCSFIDPVSAFAPIRVACLTSDFLFWSFKKKKIPNVSIKRKEDDPFDYRLKLVDRRIQSTVAFVTRNPSSCISLAMRHVTTPYCFIKINDRACYTSQPSSLFCSICMIASMNPYSVSPLFFNLKHLLFNCMQVISFYLHPLSIEACRL